MKVKFTIPAEVNQITETLKQSGFQAFLVGGCVRDLVLDRIPKDWDITTDAVPEQIIKLFPKTVYENTYGTVAVINEEVSDPTLKAVEVTPFRLEAKYSDKRHPDSVTFSKNLEDDLKRRDFTINAIAYDSDKGQVFDLFKGQEDIGQKLIRAVGDPTDRFNEDPLRMLRAVRIAAELDFSLETKIKKAIEIHMKLLNGVSCERIRDEFAKLIMSNNPMFGLKLLQETGILKVIIPELEEGLGMKQNGDHKYDVWEHIIRTVQHGADKNWPLEVRLAALFHDIGKPRTRQWSKEKNDWTFYGHDVIGAKMTAKILTRLRFSKELIETVVKLVRNHMFFTDIEKITLSAVRRIVRKVGPDKVWDLMKVRACDRIGMGRPKEEPYRLRKYESMIEEALRSPTSVGMLKIDGNKLMEIAKLPAGPKIGFILHALLEEVLDKPELNEEEYLQKRATGLSLLPEGELKKLAVLGKERKEAKEEKELSDIRKKYGVR